MYLCHRKSTKISLLSPLLFFVLPGFTCRFPTLNSQNLACQIIVSLRAKNYHPFTGQSRDHYGHLRHVSFVSFFLPFSSFAPPSYSGICLYSFLSPSPFPHHIPDCHQHQRQHRIADGRIFVTIWINYRINVPS